MKSKLKVLEKCVTAHIIEGIPAWIILLCLFFLFACKTPVSVESTVKIDSLHVREVLTTNYDSLIQQILTSLTFDYDYTLIEWSKPDSTGLQYKEKEHRIKGSGKAEKVENTTHVSNTHVAEKDSAYTRKEEHTITTPVKVLTWWDKVRIKIGNVGIVGILIVVSFVVIWLIRRKK